MKLKKLILSGFKSFADRTEFDFDDERTYFRVILPVHPRYRALRASREP